MSADPNVHRGTDRSRPLSDLRDQVAAAAVERMLSTLALGELRRSPVTGAFDLAHYQDTHRRLFGAVHDWAGQLRRADLRRVEAVLGGRSVTYSPPASIVADVNHALAQLRHGHWTELTGQRDAARFAAVVGELWRAHPFREGNTRTLLAFVEQYARHRGLPLDQAIINRVPTETRDALALATTGEVLPLATLLMRARRSELQRSHPELGRLSTEAVEALRVLGNPRVVQPAIGAEVRGRVLATTYAYVLVQEDRRIAAVPLRDFPVPPRSGEPVTVRVLALEERTAREERSERDVQVARVPAVQAELAAVLIPAAVAASRMPDGPAQQREGAAIAAPSVALASALAEGSPRAILADPSLMAEARTLEAALRARFGRSGVALLADGNTAEAQRLLPQGQDLQALRAVIKPIREAVLAELDTEMAQARRPTLERQGPGLEAGR